jgi:hypothetical protein
MAKFILGRSRLMTCLVAFAALVVIGHFMADAADTANGSRAYVHVNGSPCIGGTTGGYIQQLPDSRHVTLPGTALISHAPLVRALNNARFVPDVCAILLTFLATSPVGPPIIV